MFERVKNKINDVKEETKKRKEALARLEREKAEEAARKQRDRERKAREKAEEEARKERERIQAEKDALMALSEKELLTEVMMLLRGYDTRFNDIKKQQDYLIKIVDSLDSKISDLDSSIDSLDLRIAFLASSIDD